MVISMDTIKWKDKMNLWKTTYTTKENYLAVGMCLGLSIGMIIGHLFFNGKTMWMLYGECFGMLAGMMIHRKVSTASTDFLDSFDEDLSGEEDSFTPYLEETEYINIHDEAIVAKTGELVGKVKEQIKKEYPEVYKAVFFMVQEEKPWQLGDVDALKQARSAWIESPESGFSANEKPKNKYWKQVDKGTEAYNNLLAETLFEYVRDEVSHTHDVKRTECTATASQVFSAKTGICHAKANLLCTMYRIAGLPSGIVFQHLKFGPDEGNGYVLHALNAVYVNGTWKFVDSRGNKEGVNALYDEAETILAFNCDENEDEYFIYGIYPDADPGTMEVLKQSSSLNEAWDILPDTLTIV